MAIFIDTKRNGYDPKQCGKTLTVRELIEVLEGFDPDAKILLRNDGGYTYGSIRYEDIDEEFDEEEE
jgi:hypothetical protein